MGLAWSDGGGRGRKSGCCPRCRVPHDHTDRKGLVGRATLYRYGLSSGVLSALSWLFEILPALGVGAVPEFAKDQQQGGRGRDVTLVSGIGASVGKVYPRAVLIVMGLIQEARIPSGPGITVMCSSSDPQQL